MPTILQMSITEKPGGVTTELVIYEMGGATELEKEAALHFKDLINWQLERLKASAERRKAEEKNENQN